MKLIEHVFNATSRTDSDIHLYAIGDVHIGALNCAEKELRTLVRKIQKDPKAYWIGGGDYCDAIILNDVKRFDINTLPNWMLTGNPKTIKERIGDIIYAQRHRLCSILDPIKDKCLGLLEGNHEYSIFKHHNRNHMNEICESLSTTNLTDCAFLRLRFRRGRKYHSSSVIVFICHGHGGGRTSGSEPTRLYRLAADKNADIVLAGHSHSFHIHPPIPILEVPRHGNLPKELLVREKRAANWGSFLYTYKPGPSTYASRANYPVRPMCTVETIIQPHCVKYVCGQQFQKCRIKMNELKL